jgi:peroxiredoxin
MAQFEPLQAEIEQIGASVFFIAAEKRVGMFKPERFFTKHPVSFPFLLDEDRSVTKAYGVHNLLALDAIDIAKPATFVVDRGGVVRFIYVGTNQMDRAPIEHVMEALQSVRLEAGGITLR